MTATDTQPRARKAPEEIRGSVRWLLEMTPGHAGLLAITVERNGKPLCDTYLLTHVRDGERLIGYRLRKLTGRDVGQVYDLPANLSDCDCADRTYQAERVGGCKHMRGLTAALRSLAA